MAHLPTQGEANWGTVLNEFLLVGQNEDGTTRNHIDVINVRDYGATGDPNQPPAEVTAAVQAAATAGAHLYFPAGTYRFEQWTFTQAGQHITFAPNAILEPADEASQLVFNGPQLIEHLHIQVPYDRFPGDHTVVRWIDGLIQFTYGGATVRHLIIDAQAAVTRLIKISRAPDSRFENMSILAPRTKEGIFVENLTKCTFVGGGMQGNNSAVKTPGSAGLVLGADTAGNSAYEFRAFAFTIHHWETGIRFSGSSHDDPSFYSCNIENNVLYGLSFEPPAGSQWAGVIYNLCLFGTHFEGNYQAIHIAANAAIQSATISGCRFGLKVPDAVEAALPVEKRLPQRIIHAEGHLRGVVVSGCFSTGKHIKPDAYVWEIDGTAYNCADLFNTWVDMPNNNFSTGANFDRVIQMTTRDDSGAGRTLDLQSGFRHHGERLGFYGALPINQPAGYSTLSQDASSTAIIQQLNKLTTDLTNLGLVKQSL